MERYWISASTTEIMINTTRSPRIHFTCFFSSISFIILPLIKSNVKVELDANTREDRVDMDAESTKITTTAIKIVGRPESIVGTTES